MDGIKFRSAHYDYDGKFVIFTYWGRLNHKDEIINDFSCFKSPSSVNGTSIKSDDQYLGIKDNKGVEVYNGDIVSVHKFCEVLGENMGVSEGEKEFTATIEFSPFGGVWLESGDENSGPLWEYEVGFHEESLEVIGNIHEKTNKQWTLDT
jgi:hypothetical protein